jgi:hypothetical protein
MTVEAEFQASHQPALMTILNNQDRWDRSNVLFVESKLLEYNKAAPRADFAYIDYGLAESYAPTDNVSELTARATVFVEWLKVSKLQPKDALFIF